jgi:hypothetical protein
MPEWVRHASFSHDLRVTRDAVFRLDEALTKAGDSLPLLNREITESLSEAGARVQPRDLGSVVTGLAALVALSFVAFFRRLRPE